MSHSASLKEIAVALANAQAEFPAVPKNRTASIPTKSGNKYEYKYADLADLISAVTPVLTKHGLSVTQSPTLVDGRLVLETMLLHLSGEWKCGTYPLQSFDRAQEMGSEITYARRYTLAAILGVHAEEDEDGSLASQGSSAAKQALKPIAPVSSVNKIPNAFNTPKADHNPTCERCNSVLVVSKSGEGMYCPHFKDTANGEHTRIRIKDVEQYKKYRREAAEAALAEEVV